jgi:cysteine desulfurase
VSVTFLDLDANATTRPDPRVIDVVAKHQRETWGNPGSRHALGRRARRVLEESRERIAALLGADPAELIFTSGGTEANNTAVFGLVRGAGGALWLTPGEHPANHEACKALLRRGYRLERLPLDAAGRVMPCPIETPPGEARLLAAILAHNETGVVQDPAVLRDWATRLGAPLHLDGVQAVGKIPVDFHAFGATTLAFGAHKFHGPRGVGGLLLRKGTRLTPLMYGGHQEQERRPGTEAVPLIAGMATALELWHAEWSTRSTQLQQLRDRLQAGLRDRCPPTVVNGEEAPRLPNTLNIAFPGLDGEALLVALDLAGVGCSLGTTCASGSTEPAPVLVAMGCPPEVYKASVRFSLSRDNTIEEIDDAIERVAMVVNRLRGR